MQPGTVCGLCVNTYARTVQGVSFKGSTFRESRIVAVRNIESCSFQGLLRTYYNFVSNDLKVVEIVIYRPKTQTFCEIKNFHENGQILVYL